MIAAGVCSVRCLPLVAFVFGCVAYGFAPQASPDSSVQQYARAIAQAQADLDGGRLSEARQRLEATDPSMRSFEHEYLLARLQAARGKGPAPDLIRTLPAPPVQNRYGVLNPVDRQLVFICRDGRLRVYELAAPDAPPKTLAHGAESAIWSGAFSRDGKTFAAGYENGTVQVWDPKTWKVRHTVALGSNSPVREIAVAPDGSAFAAEGQAELELWSLAGATPAKVAGIGLRYNFGLAFSPTGDLVATGGMFDILLHNAQTGERTKSLRHASYTMGLEFAPDGKRIASAPRGNVNRFLAVFDVTQGTQLFHAGPFACYVDSFTFTPDGKRIVSTACDKVRTLQMFDSSTGVVVAALGRSEPGAKPALSHDGRLLGWSESGGYRFIELGAKSVTADP
jgi:WD40 repeat protein